ncbi:hypothetical protein LVJ94_37315 [Pendulispora rubella]|uniref:Uncharacterized protein n=1 Tax=Pendulispora rubella TaxID=2741070 RepID=A0ABZ2L1T7_9BACT
MPASDSVPPADDASTVVTEFPQHLIDALEQSAGLPPRAASGTPPHQVPVPPSPAQPTAPISPMATVEMPAVLVDTLDVPGLPPSSKNPTVVRPPFTTLTQHDAPTPAMGSPSYPADQLEQEPVSVDPDEIEDLQLEPYESPISVDIVPPSASPGPTPPAPIPPPPASAANLGAANLGAPNAEPPVPSFTFAPQRPPSFAPAKPALAWAEPPPPILMDPPTSAIGWAIGGIVVGLLLLGLVVWLVVLAVRHFM